MGQFRSARSKRFEAPNTGEIAWHGKEEKIRACRPRGARPCGGSLSPYGAPPAADVALCFHERMPGGRRPGHFGEEPLGPVLVKPVRIVELIATAESALAA
jgi:hypothetical protein